MRSDASAPRLRLGLIILGALAIAGCSKRESAPVSGQVTLNGEPQEGIYVYFQPAVPPGGDPMNVGTSSYARTDAEGRFTLNFMDVDKDRPGALVGSHSVRLDDERTFGGGPVKSRVPRKWEGTFVVPDEGTSEANFELSQRN
jgi:hypothetical protein